MIVTPSASEQQLESKTNREKFIVAKLCSAKLKCFFTKKTMIYFSLLKIMPDIKWSNRFTETLRASIIQMQFLH